MISRETLTRYEKVVEHMREVHGRAVLLNMAVVANFGRLLAEERWIIKGYHKKASDMSARSTKVLNKAMISLHTLQLAYEERASADWETTIAATTRCLVRYKNEMRIIENMLPVVYPEHIMAILEDWFVKIQSGELPFGGPRL